MIPLSITFNHAVDQERFQKLLRFKSGKDIVNVSHTVNNVFSIVEQPQRGAAVNSTISFYLYINFRGTNCRDGVPGLGGSDATLADVPRRYSTLEDYSIDISCICTPEYRIPNNY